MNASGNIDKFQYCWLTYILNFMSGLYSVIKDRSKNLDQWDHQLFNWITRQSAWNFTFIVSNTISRLLHLIQEVSCLFVLILILIYDSLLQLTILFVASKRVWVLARPCHLNGGGRSSETGIWCGDLWKDQIVEALSSIGVRRL